MSKLIVISLFSTYCIYFIHSLAVKRSTCQENEMHLQSSHCGPKACEDLGHPVRCGGATELWTPQCVCVGGHVRDTNGTCIPKNECPSCGGDVNAVTGCGNHCGNSCSDYKEENKTCLTGCQYNRCDCKKGYVYHDDLKKCVLPVDCSARR